MAQNQFEKGGKQGDQSGNQGNRSDQGSVSQGQDKSGGKSMNPPLESEGKDKNRDDQRGQRGYTDPSIDESAKKGVM